MEHATNALALLAPNVRDNDAPPCPYAALIGSWEVTVRWYAQRDEPKEGKGEWYFSWILGGWGVQDVLFAAGANADRRGTSVRCYDADAGGWRVVWMMPAGREFAALLAREEDNRIVQEGTALDGSSRQRWTFSQITDNGFLWHGECSSDGGATWTLEQEMLGTRRPAAATSELWVT